MDPEDEGRRAPTRSLILMRHARQRSLGGRDHENPLTEEGRRQASQVGERLLSDRSRPTRVLCSTAVRCRETWACIVAALGDEVAIDFLPALYNASSGDILDQIAQVDEATNHLLVLAHNPGISVLGLGLAGEAASDSGEREIDTGFTPASTATFTIAGPWSTLGARTASLVDFTRMV